MRQVAAAPVDEVLHALDDLGTHPPDGEVLVAVRAPEVALLGREEDEVEPVIAERGDQLPIERGDARRRGRAHLGAQPAEQLPPWQLLVT